MRRLRQLVRMVTFVAALVYLAVWGLPTGGAGASIHPERGPIADLPIGPAGESYEDVLNNAHRDLMDNLAKVRAQLRGGGTPPPSSGPGFVSAPTSPAGSGAAAPSRSMPPRVFPQVRGTGPRTAPVAQRKVIRVGE